MEGQGIVPGICRANVNRGAAHLLCSFLVTCEGSHPLLGGPQGGPQGPACGRQAPQGSADGLRRMHWCLCQ